MQAEEEIAHLESDELQPLCRVMQQVKLKCLQSRAWDFKGAMLK